MAYDIKITDEAALKAAQPDLFKINARLLKKRLLAAKTLGQVIPGAELIEYISRAKDAPADDSATGIAHIDRAVEA